jgi:hypothetical protein
MGMFRGGGVVWGGVLAECPGRPLLFLATTTKTIRIKISRRKYTQKDSRFFKDGTVVPLGTTGAKMLPSIATPRDKGTTSSSRRSAVSAD